MTFVQKKISTKIGDLYLVASLNGLSGVYWEEPSFSKDLSLCLEVTQILHETEKQLCEYFSGNRKFFNLPLAINGTEFQKKVWQQLLKIPYGETNSYIEIATKIKNNKANRAVGTANGKNPLCIIIPCHRVIAADGTLGGYSGGLSIKSKLLDLEKNGFIV